MAQRCRPYKSRRDIALLLLMERYTSVAAFLYESAADYLDAVQLTAQVNSMQFTHTNDTMCCTELSRSSSSTRADIQGAAIRLPSLANVKLLVRLLHNTVVCSQKACYTCSSCVLVSRAGGCILRKLCNSSMAI
jgi:hypothetical protein